MKFSLWVWAQLCIPRYQRSVKMFLAWPLTTNPLFPAEPGGPTGPLEPCKWVKSLPRQLLLSPILLTDKLTHRTQTWVHLRPLLSCQHHLVHQQDLEGREVPVVQPNPLNPDFLGLPTKSYICQSLEIWKTTHSSDMKFVSYSLSKNAVLSRGAIRSCRTLRSRQTHFMTNVNTC